MKKPEDISYSLEISDDFTEVAIVIASDLPLTQDDFIDALLAFIKNADAGSSQGLDNWMFDLSGKYN